MIAASAIAAAAVGAAMGIAKLAFFIKRKRQEAKKQKQLDAIEVDKARSGK